MSGYRTESDAGVTHTPLQAKLAIGRTRRVVDKARFAVGWNIPSRCTPARCDTYDIFGRRMSSSCYAMCLTTIRRLQGKLTAKMLCGDVAGLCPTSRAVWAEEWLSGGRQAAALVRLIWAGFKAGGIGHVGLPSRDSTGGPLPLADLSSLPRGPTGLSCSGFGRFKAGEIGGTLTAKMFAHEADFVPIMGVVIHGDDQDSGYDKGSVFYSKVGRAHLFGAYILLERRLRITGRD
ncbi:hypothetical protein FOXB_00749 [Fusarium oxysporum f. sp. conglutinans Fo5176]|uniref:Uncharacterized protein n=1 Tax=Fusarium oxysporum (strain Fo5176) TaxID=660025 RepID=F9F2X4_FUSOF|nr:hypothetical protein FOXB_00749 [Fusarium oxysporum f. sp. conglutinans Fo5176]